MSLLCPSVNSFSSPEEVWTTAFSELGQRIRRYFTRREPNFRALAYVQALMSSTERKNGWQVAEEVGEATPYAMQHLLDRAKWDCLKVRAYGNRALVLLVRVMSHQGRREDRLQGEAHVMCIC